MNILVLKAKCGQMGEALILMLNVLSDSLSRQDVEFAFDFAMPHTHGYYAPKTDEN